MSEINTSKYVKYKYGLIDKKIDQLIKDGNESNRKNLKPELLQLIVDLVSDTMLEEEALKTKIRTIMELRPNSIK